MTQPASPPTPPASRPPRNVRLPQQVEAICTTPGCPQNGRSRIIQQRLRPIGQGLYETTPVVCGGCGASITPTMLEDQASVTLQ